MRCVNSCEFSCNQLRCSSRFYVKLKNHFSIASSIYHSICDVHWKWSHWSLVPCCHLRQPFHWSIFLAYSRWVWWCFVLKYNQWSVFSKTYSGVGHTDGGSNDIWLIYMYDNQIARFRQIMDLKFILKSAKVVSLNLQNGLAQLSDKG